MGYLREIINLAIAGFMDSDTILAFLRACNLVDTNADIPADRSFGRTMEFPDEVVDVDMHSRERHLAELYRDSGLTPLSLRSTVAMIRSVVSDNDITEVLTEKAQADLIEEAFWTWRSTLAHSETALPTSPRSPNTMAQALMLHSDLLHGLPAEDVATVFAYIQTQLEEEGNLALAAAIRNSVKFEEEL